MKQDGSLQKFYQYAFPMPTVLVTCIDKDNKPNAITIAWHTPLSKKPPLHAVSMAPQRHSYSLIQESKEFTINFLHYSQARDAHFCGTHSGRKIDKHTNTNLTYIPAKKIAAPLIKEAYAHLECTLNNCMVVGDHVLLVGEVQNVTCDADAFSDDLLNTAVITPLYYLGNNKYVTLDRQKQIMF